MTRTLCLGIVLILAGSPACTRGPATSAVEPFVLTLGVPDRENESVSVAAAGEVVALTWSARTSTRADVYAAVSSDGGRTFASPVRVNEGTRPVQARGEQPPRIALVPAAGGPPEIAIAWLEEGSSGTLLLNARSTDGGRTFGQPAIVPGTEAVGNRGWHAIAADSGGRVHALWLDHRDTASASKSGSAHHQHQHGASSPEGAADGAARAQLSQLYVGALDGSMPAIGIARGVCYCCKTALVAGSEGTTYAAWRHVYPGGERDIAFTVSRDGGRSFAEPVRVSADRWQINACPENGPALAVDTRQRVHVVWPTLVERSGGETLQLFHAVTADGRTFTPRTAVPAAGVVYHPQLAATADGAVVAAWEETAAEGRRVRLFRLDSKSPRDLGPGVYPAVASTTTHTIVAWTDRRSSRGVITVARLVHGEES